MGWKRGWISAFSLFVLLSPFNLEAKVNLNTMNLLKKVETLPVQNGLIIKFIFKNNLKYFEQPIFYKKSVQIDFPNSYSQPAKRFLTTGNSKISQIYISQFSSQKMRVRFIFGKGEEASYENRFHLQKNENSLTVRIDLSQDDLLDQLLARVTQKNQRKELSLASKKVSTNVSNDKNIKEPIGIQIKKAVVVDSDDLKNDLLNKVKRGSLTVNPQLKDEKKKSNKFSKTVTKGSFNFLNLDDKTTSMPAKLESSGFKMVMTLSLVLGLIFLLFFGFKKYVLKNTVFGSGGKLVQIISSSYLSPKKNISVVEIAGEILVLGISDQNISLLTSIREPKRVEEIRNAREDNSGSVSWQQGIPGEVAGKVSLATSNAKNLFSKYLKEFSGSKSEKESSTLAVTEKIRDHMRKVRST